MQQTHNEQGLSETATPFGVFFQFRFDPFFRYPETIRDAAGTRDHLF